MDQARLGVPRGGRADSQGAGGAPRARRTRRVRHGPWRRLSDPRHAVPARPGAQHHARLRASRRPGSRHGLPPDAGRNAGLHLLRAEGRMSPRTIAALMAAASTALVGTTLLAPWEGEAAARGANAAVREGR